MPELTQSQIDVKNAEFDAQENAPVNVVLPRYVAVDIFHALAQSLVQSLKK